MVGRGEAVASGLIPNRGTSNGKDFHIKQKKWKSDFKVMCIISMGYTKKTGMHRNKRKNLLPSAKHLEEWWGALSNMEHGGGSVVCLPDSSHYQIKHFLPKCMGKKALRGRVHCHPKHSPKSISRACWEAIHLSTKWGENCTKKA